MPKPVPPPPLGEVTAWPCTLDAVVEESYLDGNGHMNVAWYTGLFDRATWAFFALHGLDGDYLARTRRGMFAVEQLLRYYAELRGGERLRIHTRLRDAGDKTIEFTHGMVHVDKEQLAATAELTGVHVDLTTRRSVPFAPEIRARLDIR
jgi:acyl-CoA thioester hydrolase